MFTGNDPDPRLEIPQVLREPAGSAGPGTPAQPRRADAGMWGMAKAWGIALDFLFTIFAGAALVRSTGCRVAQALQCAL